ncbi:helix-turn-helix domain-containing protein [Rhizobium oryzihabitans]|uniref:Helix-turn-helix domain-containing protein n=1 Tax=Rhizobium oryzihabitans TaxID=2267833 RepID=A0A7L5BH40_9HYPH|nr:helix-turn-helix domain-containing protein [Rhizobium oryzihabitans]QIB38135.1 helix-turn-helix domain-containing protein [Rhizobium oryzihabitans]
MARQTSYKPEYAEQAEKLCEQGLTDKQLAEFFGVSDRTIQRWKIEYPEFCQSLKVGKDISDEAVERSLFQRAIGYSHPDVDIKVIDGQVVKTEVTKHYPPDTVAAIFWLKNRKPKDWRDKQEVELNVNGSLAERLNRAKARKPEQK